ncbi:MAG: sugar phosphate isomerase/epimerase family protein [Anaerolineae bacterium]|jgi:sugar phosphate isomerase/epimerase
MKPALFTVSYGGYWGQARLSLPDALRKAKELGYPAVEIMGKRPHLSVVDVSLDDAKELRRQVDDLGLEVATIAAYTNFTGGLESREVPFVEVQLAYLKRLAELGEVLGAKNMRIFTGYFTDQLPYLAQWNLCVDAVREAAGIAAQHGITLGVQNHHDIGVSAESYEDFLDAVGHENCKAMFDAWSIALHDSDLYYWAKKLAPRMVQTTVADYVKHPRWHLVANVTNYERVLPDALLMVPMGDGFIDYDAFFRGLKEGGFDGYVAYEMCWPIRGGGSIESLDACASKSLQEIKRLIGE